VQSKSQPPQPHALREHAHHHDVVIDRRGGERRTRWVVLIATTMMFTELIVGSITGSLALTADGWHMATHVGALGMTLGAYWFARTRATSDAFTFGTGKVYALAGYTSGIVLALVAVWMFYEAEQHLVERPFVDFGEALPIAVLGLGVNLVSAVLLGHGHVDHGHDHDHDHDHDDHDHDHDDHDHDHDHDHDDHDHDHHHDHDRRDHNLRAAYLHVLADAVTSVLAIGALCAGRWAGMWYLDPVAGLVGGVVVLSWSVSLCRAAGRQLLDVVPNKEHERTLRARLEAVDDVRIADLHVWELGPGSRGCIVSLVTAQPREIDYYRGVILDTVSIDHLTVEVHCCSLGHA
jgi:cation diffusion facilitator family transporter